MKQYLLRLDKSLLKDLQDLPSKQYKQIVQKILSLPMDPKPQDAKALKGVKNGYRVTQGEYRILYYLVEPSGDRLGEVQVFRVGKRNDGEVYRNL
jgi:mRNA interferase RelE/StbE